MDNRIFESGAQPAPPTVPAAPSAGYPTNGDPIAAVNPTVPGAFWFHQLGEEMRAVLTAAGITPSTANNAQLLEAIQRLIDAQSGNYALDTGAANVYVVALSPAITAYVDGMTVRVRVINANTGASTLNAGGGAVALVNDVGGALVNGDVPASSIFAATYIASVNKFYINSLVPSQAITQAAADARYAALISALPTGALFDHAGITAPSGSLVCPTAATNISRTTYAALFAVIGTTWGVGDGSTTFGMPWFAADYTSVQANSNVGTSTVGAVISHSHGIPAVTNGASGTTTDLMRNNGSGVQSAVSTSASGSSANLAAGVRVLKCIKY